MNRHDTFAVYLCGMITGLGIGNALHHHLTPNHAVITISILVILCIVYVVIELSLGMRRMKRDRLELIQMMQKAQAELHDATERMDYWKEKTK